MKESDQDPGVQRALERIEDAQQQLARAAEDLSPVDGFVEEWRATLELYEKAKAHWFAVANRDAQRRGVPPVLP